MSSPTSSNEELTVQNLEEGSHFYTSLSVNPEKAKTSEAYLGHCQKSMMESLTIFAKMCFRRGHSYAEISIMNVP